MTPSRYALFPCVLVGNARNDRRAWAIATVKPGPTEYVLDLHAGPLTHAEATDELRRLRDAEARERRANE